MTLNTGVIAAKNSALHHRNKLHFEIYLNRKQLFYILTLYSIMIFTTFESIVCDQKIKAFTCFIYF